MINGKNPGAEWLRVDLHLHSPCSKSFTLPSGLNLDSQENRQRLAREYADRLSSQGIHVAAITDYNGISGMWYPAIRKEADEKGITIFPGVELSFSVGKYGLHVLLIFEFDFDLQAIERLVYSIEKNPGKSIANERDHRDIEPKYDIAQFLKYIRDTYQSKCVIIFPHPTDENGLCKSLQAEQRAELLLLADAIEPISTAEQKKIISTGKLPENFFDRIAILENSDPKSLEEIGTKLRGKLPRATYIKMGAKTIDSLRFALHDPQVRVRLYERPDMLFDRITRLQITGSAFVKDLEMTFHPELNTLIGGRGVGKSTVLESIRYAMDLPIYSDKSERLEFVHSVVGSGGDITLHLERYYGDIKKRFVVKRTIGKDTEIFDEQGNKTDLSVKGLFDRQGFPILIGQKELYHVSTSQNFQLHLIDQIIGETVWSGARSFQKSLALLEENALKLLEIERKTAQRQEYEQRHKNVESEIEVLRDLKVEDKLKRWTTIIEDDQRVQETEETVRQLHESSDDFFSQWESRLSALSHSLGQGKSEHKKLLDLLAEQIDSLKSSLIQARDGIEDQIKGQAKTINELVRQWKAGKETIESEMQSVKRELGQKGLDPERLGALTRERAQLDGLLAKMASLNEEFENLRADRERVKRELGEKRLGLFRLRQKRLESINTVLDGILRISVKYEEEVEEFKEELRNLLKGSNVSNDAVSSIVSTPQKTIDGLLISKYIQEGEDRIRNELGLTPAMATRVFRWFSESERLYRLEALFPDDKIEIELNVGGKYRPIARLSVGQKATALLLLLFAQEKRILLLDQPEEDLDNRFIYEDVVKVLRTMKGKRQLIIATHNANIPVLGDAEYILALEQRKESCSIAAQGAIETMKAEVKGIMEGGEEAFRLRAGKYGES